MPHGSITSYLRPGHPVENQTDTSIGSIYAYRGPTSTLTTNTPVPGETWADGRPVINVSRFEITGASDYSDLIVVTGQNVGYSGTIGSPAVEQTFYGLRYKPVQLPLEVHPEFRTGGTALDATARRCIIGWRAEQSPTLRSEYKFRELDSTGTPGDEVDISVVSPNALEFIKRCELGVEEYTFYLPVWRKHSIYKGSVAPSSTGIGQKETPGGTPPTYGSSTAYEWVKSADDVERIGTTSRWRRVEEWEGAIKVYVDIDEVFAL
jgi:hypothetical protein